MKSEMQNIESSIQFLDVPVGLNEDIRTPEFMGILIARSPEWPKVRKQHFLSHPVCAACGGKKGLEVHHIKPFHIFPELELYYKNLITLCDTPARPCHRIFGHLYNWMRWNPQVVDDCDTMLGRILRGNS